MLPSIVDCRISAMSTDPELSFGSPIGSCSGTYARSGGSFIPCGAFCFARVASPQQSLEANGHTFLVYAQILTSYATYKAGKISGRVASPPVATKAAHCRHEIKPKTHVAQQAVKQAFFSFMLVFTTKGVQC